jgi:hypothetical protein
VRDFAKASRKVSAGLPDPLFHELRRTFATAPRLRSRRVGGAGTIESCPGGEI